MDKIQILKHLEELTHAAGFENCLIVFSNSENVQMVKVEPIKYPHQEKLFGDIIEMVIRASNTRPKITAFDSNYQQPENN